jgi:archaellum component FlaG (FlaF/FlaG flagellin family)
VNASCTPLVDRTLKMKKHEYLVKCTRLIEDKLQWGNSSEWIDFNFSRLNELIFEASKISISVRTLKRIFKSDDHYEPQIATKNALVHFLGYRDWTHFVKENFENGQNEMPLPPAGAAPVVEKPKGKTYKIIAFIIAILIVMSVLLIIIQRHDKVSFTVKNNTGSAPLTAAISYDLSGINYKSTFIDFGNDGEYKLLLNEKGELSYLYKTPNFFKIRMIADGVVIAKATVNVKTEGWVCYVGNNDANAQIVTNRKLFGNNGMLYFPTEAISKLNIDTKKEFWVDYRNIRDFHVNGDRMTIEFRLRNSKGIGGLDCFDTSLEFSGENGRGRYRLVKPGCTQYADSEFGDTQLTGNFHNLSSLGVDLSKWTIIKIEIKNSTSLVYVDNVFKYKTSYKTPIGNIRGLFCRFKGSGQVDYIRVYNQDGKLVYGDEFNN